MIQICRVAILFSCFNLSGCASVAAENNTTHAQIVFIDSNETPQIVDIQVSDTISNVELDLGEWSKRFTIIMPEFAGAASFLVKARQRQTRCLSISNEGPHLDFYDWKTQSTDWKDLARVQSIKWKSASFDKIDYGVMPQILGDEIEKKVRESLSDPPESITEWLSLARKCSEQPESCFGECFSEIQFYRENGGSDEIVTTIRMRIPLGC